MRKPGSVLRTYLVHHSVDFEINNKNGRCLSLNLVCFKLFVRVCYFTAKPFLIMNICLRPSGGSYPKLKMFFFLCRQLG